MGTRKERARHVSLCQVSAVAQNIKYYEVVYGVELGCMIVVLMDVSLAKQMVAFVILVRLINAAVDWLGPKPGPERHQTAFVNLKDVNVNADNSPLSITTPLFTVEEMPILASSGHWSVLNRLNAENNPPSISSCSSSPLLSMEAAHKQRATSTWAPRMPKDVAYPDCSQFKRTGKVILNNCDNGSFGKRSTQSF